MTDIANGTETFPHRHFRVETSGSESVRLVKDVSEQHDYARELATEFLNGAFLHIAPVTQQQADALRNAATISDHKNVRIELVTREADVSDNSWKKIVRSFLNETSGMSVFSDVKHDENEIFLEITPMDALLNLFTAFNVEGEISLVMVGDEDSPEVLYQTDDNERPLTI